MRLAQWSPNRQQRRLLKGLSIFGLAGLAAACVLLLVAFWPSAESSRYRAAKPCVVPPSAPTAECTVTLSLSVIDAHQTYGRGGNHHYYALRSGQVQTTARVDSFLIWFPRFQVGGVVQAEVWNGKVTRLTGDGASFITTASPLSRQQDFERASAYVGLAAWLPFLLSALDTIRRSLIQRSAR